MKISGVTAPYHFQAYRKLPTPQLLENASPPGAFVERDLPAYFRRDRIM
jgi:hypothetical protein